MEKPITFVRAAAPPIKYLRAKGLPTPRKGSVPSTRVLIAVDEDGREWAHERIFRSDEHHLMLGLLRRVDDAERINPKHWSRL